MASLWSRSMSAARCRTRRSPPPLRSPPLPRLAHRLATPRWSHPDTTQSRRCATDKNASTRMPSETPQRRHAFDSDGSRCLRSALSGGSLYPSSLSPSSLSLLFSLSPSSPALPSLFSLLTPLCSPLRPFLSFYLFSTSSSLYPREQYGANCITPRRDESSSQS